MIKTHTHNNALANRDRNNNKHDNRRNNINRMYRNNLDIHNRNRNRDNNDISPAVLEGCGGKQNLIGNLTNNGKFCVYPTFTKINAGLCKIVIENIRTPEKAEKANVSTRLFEIASLQSYNVIQNVKFFQSPLVQAKIYNATMNLSNFNNHFSFYLKDQLSSDEVIEISESRKFKSGRCKVGV